MSPRPRARTALSCLGLAAAVFLAYGRTAGHVFVAYDTGTYVTENPWVLRGLSLDGVKWAFTHAYAANWHPLTWLSHMLDVEVFGLRAGLHALENVAWHAANACLVLLVLERMTGAWGRSLFVAALFALHPLHVESVAWIVERKDVLSTFFGLACLLFWTGWAMEGRRSAYALALACLALGLSAKPMLVTWPCVLLVLDFWPLGRASLGARRLLLEKLPFFALAALSGVATVLAQGGGGAVQSLSNLPFSSRAANALLSYAGYLGKTLWPTNLAFYYPHPVQGYAPAQLALAAFVLIAASAAALRLRRSAPWFLAGWLFYLGTLVPVIGIVQVGGQAMADRYTYVPLLGLFLIVAWGSCALGAAIPRLRALLAPLAVAVSTGLGFLAWQQAGTWKDTTTLARHALAVTRDNHVAHDVLGIAILEAGRLDEAAEQFREALAIAPGDVEAASNLGGALQRQDRFPEAEAVLRKALALSPRRGMLHRRLAIVLQFEARLPEALSEIDFALALAPDDAVALHVRGQLLDRLGRPGEARTALERSVEVAPLYTAARLTLARLLLHQGEVDAAEREIARAIAAEPGNAEAHRGRARALLLRGREGEALDELRETLRLAPEWPVAMGDMTWILARSADPARRDPRAAVELGERAVRASGERTSGVLDALAAAYAASGRFAEAAAAAEKALARAREVGESDLAARIEKRLTAYRAQTIDPETPR
jgi:Flp pilus assembly protein TadD